MTAVKTPVASNFAYGQIRRLKRLPGYPGAYSELENELVQALMDVAEDEQHCERIVTKLLRGWRNPALDSAQRAKEAHFCPQVVDVLDCAKFGDEVEPGQLQPDEYKRSNWNPIDALKNNGWMYESMCDVVLAGWQQRAQDPTCRSYKLAVEIVPTMQRRREAMGDFAWLAEREKANRVCMCEAGAKR